MHKDHSDKKAARAAAAAKCTRRFLLSAEMEAIIADNSRGRLTNDVGGFIVVLMGEKFDNKPV